MKTKITSTILAFVAIISVSLLTSSCRNKIPDELPNILWLTSEDNSPFLGCYGDDFATTPNLDKLATEGFLYTHAYANAPVCAPARNTILTGVYACSSGNEHMRSKYSRSDIVKPYPMYLKLAGYYCTNNSKTDYNISLKDIPEDLWDESSKEAHWKNRPEGKPFFAIFNTTVSHESSIFRHIPNEDLRHSPEEVFIPPYHPATPEMKHDWAQYYDKIEDMDAIIGEHLKELEEAGLADNTIVFYYGDHGGVLARSKRYVYETGTRVPFIVRIPEKYKYLFPEKKVGSKVDRLISFVDLVPTLLSIAGIEVPDYLQGNAFLGEQKTEDPEYAYMFRGRMDERYDMSRAVRDHKYRYIRNYMPYRIYGQKLQYLFSAASIRSWKAAYEAGECNDIQSIFWETKPVEELYDTENDPWEVNNLAKDPDYKDVLLRMRKANKDWVSSINDVGFIPEAERIDRAGDTPLYDYMRSGKVENDRIIDAAEIATTGDAKNLAKLQEFLTDSESAIRYWGAVGMLILEDEAFSAIPELQKALSDESESVVSAAAEALYNLGEKDVAKKALLSVLKSDNLPARCYALNVIDCIEESSLEVQKSITDWYTLSSVNNSKGYDFRAANTLLKKWGLDPKIYEVQN
jgi:N-sulfoglucosamine sulfohydrolase